MILEQREKDLDEAVKNLKDSMEQQGIPEDTWTRKKKEPVTERQRIPGKVSGAPEKI